MSDETATSQGLVHVPNTPFQHLLQRQEELEASCVADGITRFRERVITAQQNGRGSQVGAAKKLLQSAIDPLAASLSALVEEGRMKPGRKHYVTKWIETVGPDALAYLTVKTVLDGITTRVALRKVASALAERLEDEMRFRRFKEQAPELFDYSMAKFTTSHYAHMARSLDARMRYAKIDTSDLEIPKQQRQVMGIKLVDLLIDATGLVQIVRLRTNTSQRRTKIRDEVLLEATPATLEWLDVRNGGLEGLWPIFMPMVVPPIEWTPERRGGYRFALRGKHPLVRGVSKPQAAVIKAADMPVVFQALNAIQGTAWRINSRVLGVVEAIMQSGKGLAGVPAFENTPLPERPHDIATNDVARKAWRRAAHLVKEANHSRKMKALEFQKTYAVANALRSEPSIYFPANLDFRGRVYPVTNYLNPQGDDLSKALLTFSEGKALGRKGAVWLALHGANCLGETGEGLKLSRCTLQERVDWIFAHSDELTRAAADPFAHVGLWAGANVDDPLQFYAFCCEWAGYAAAHREGNGEDYCCSLPCAMDGTCNGLQHFAALLRDPIGARAVNVSPSDRPQDIYQRIADVVTERLEADASENPHARLWLASGLVNRKLCKRPTMTFGYGSKKYGFQQQTVEYVKSHERYPELRPLFSEGERRDVLLQPASGYMAGLIWSALQGTVVAASQGMQWMQEAARMVARGKRCVSWTAPGTNFPVRQEYMQYTSRRIETVLAGKLFKPVLHEDTTTPDILKQTNAIAPNFIHSLDASALQLTVSACLSEGVLSFGMVHDSYATHAADCETLARVTREQFVRLYTDADVITRLAEELRGQCVPGDDAPFPVVPSSGSLDLSGVVESRYFFS